MSAKPKDPASCPTCGAAMAENAERCGACGSAIHSAAFVDGPPFVPDLTERGARQAAAIVRDAQVMPRIVILSLICFPVALLYAVRLIHWYYLNSVYSELRHPNSLSKHRHLAIQFQDAKLPLWIVFVVGTVSWIFCIIASVLNVPLRYK
jgi:hypothetical protein